jgi:hypothetical protein
LCGFSLGGFVQDTRLQFGPALFDPHRKLHLLGALSLQLAGLLLHKSGEILKARHAGFVTGFVARPEEFLVKVLDFKVPVGFGSAASLRIRTR